MFIMLSQLIQLQSCNSPSFFSSFVLLLQQLFFLHQLDGLNHVCTVIRNDQLHLLCRYTALSKRVFKYSRENRSFYL